jgi:hypothetical protein
MVVHDMTPVIGVAWCRGAELREVVLAIDAPRAGRSAGDADTSGLLGQQSNRWLRASVCRRPNAEQESLGVQTPPVCRLWGHDVALAAGDVLDEDYVQIVTTLAGNTGP